LAADPKLANILYHDWEASSYDAKWSISYDQRCIAYARDRFVHIAGDQGWPYGDALEVGCGTGFFLLNLMQAGLTARGSVTDLSPGMVAAALRNAESLGLDVDGRVADAEQIPYEDATFDVVVGHAVLHHIPDLDAAFREGGTVTAGNSSGLNDGAAALVIASDPNDRHQDSCHHDSQDKGAQVHRAWHRPTVRTALARAQGRPTD
jgi:SAM-dependent methyltransferase